ncbi:mechanosensitive ion channel family protein [Actinoalloteichus hymeniacidonis]|uniref:Uncharacterized protein n=1 Tax=Actinoalloteichus hymeniacidonis TaxID=340345 RepID=A0AAC9N0U0_9PSEU|nr:hypothetical protein [Actinoalloteichus hymeniacidonis]AOS65221.1 hypothetical protein TL08_22195 [Actinoalloteichus hymeniacidonis]MBB5906699.1 flagellar biosynthesis protein FliQ [Actinoalloteichus hymeniacidonis]
MGQNIRNGLGEAWSMIATFVPKLIGFLIILLIGWLIAKGVSKALGLLLHRRGFHRFVEKTGLSDMLNRSKVDLGEILLKIIYYFILLITLQIAFSMFGSGNAISQLLHSVIVYIPRVVVALILVLIAASIGRVVRDLIRSALAGRSYGHLLGTLAFAFLIGLGVIAALNQLGIAITVTLPVLITVLATIGGILVVGLGGGLIRPAQQRWSTWLEHFESERSTGSRGSGAGQHTGGSSAAGGAGGRTRRTPGESDPFDPPQPT